MKIQNVRTDRPVLLTDMEAATDLCLEDWDPELGPALVAVFDAMRHPGSILMMGRRWVPGSAIARVCLGTIKKGPNLPGSAIVRPTLRGPLVVQNDISRLEIVILGVGDTHLATWSFERREQKAPEQGPFR